MPNTTFCNLCRRKVAECGPLDRHNGRCRPCNNRSKTERVQRLREKTCARCGATFMGQQQRRMCFVCVPERRPGASWATSNGYIARHEPSHPLALGRGRVAVHRAVLYAKIGDGPHLCHWCGVAVNWGRWTHKGALVVDHVDFDKANNNPSNLVPSCHRCNCTRRPG